MAVRPFSLRSASVHSEVIDDVLFLDSWNPLPFLLAPPNFKASMRALGAFSDSLHRDTVT